MKSIDLEKFGQSFLRFFSYFDIYSSQPTLNIKPSTKFKTKIGTLITFSFIFVVLLIFLAPVLNYFSQTYIEQVSQSTKLAPMITKKAYITGKNFFLIVAFKQANGIYQDPKISTESFLKSNMVIYNTYSQYYYQLIIENDCTNYTNNFENAPPIYSCLRIPDGVSFELNFQTHDQLVLLFEQGCNNPILCSYNYYSSTLTSYKNFFLQNSIEIFFTTRYVDTNNQVKFQWNMVSSKQFYQSASSYNYIKIGISNFTYYIDDSIFPWNNNKTHQLESYFSNSQIAFIMTPNNIIINGVQFVIYDDTRIYVSHRSYPLKINMLLGMLGGGIFILYLIFGFGAKTYNRYQSQFELTENLYVCRVDESFSNVQIGTIQSLIFMLYKHYHLKQWNWINKFQYFKKLKNYQQIYDSSNYDRDCINLLKKCKNIKMNLQYQYNLPIKYNNHSKQIIKDVVEPSTQQFLERLSPQQTQKIELVGITDRQFYLLNNIDNETKNKYLSNQQLYQQVIENKKVNVISKHSKISQEKVRFNIFTLIGKILQYFDIFKVTPSFILEKRQMHGTCFSAFLTFLFIILSILTFYIPFSYFMAKHTDLITQVYDTTLSDIDIKHITTQNLNLSICFSTMSGYLVSLSSYISGQMNLQLIQYDRIGNITTNTSYQFKPIGNYNTSYFDSKINLNYTICYKPPDNIKLRIKGSSSDESQSYFSIKFGQYCYFLNQSACDNVKALNRNSTLFILNHYRMLLIIGQSNYNVYMDSIQQSFNSILLFPQYGLANSSIVQRILVDELKIFDDKSIWRNNPIQKISYITNIDRSNNYGYILPPDNNDVSYQLFFNPSGRTNHYIVTQAKFDIIFGMIGGVFMFMYGLFGILAYFYNDFYQKLFLGTKLFRYRNDSSSNIKGSNTSLLKEFLYLLFYPFRSRIQKSIILNPLKPLKKIDDQISNIYSLEYVIFKLQVFMRHLKALQKDKQQSEVLEIYLKQNLNNQVLDDRQNSRAINNSNTESRTQSQTQSISRKFRDQNLYKKNKKKEYSMNNQLAPIIEQQISDKKDQINNIQNLLPQNQQRPINKYRKKSSTKCSDFIKHIHDFISYFDIFGIGGELTLNNSVKFGTWLSGIFSIIGIIVIFIIIIHYTLLYLNGDKFSVTQIISNTDYLSYKQTFLTGDNFKYALGFVNNSNPGLRNVSLNTSGDQPLLRLIIIQSIINRTIAGVVTYTQKVYNLTTCPNNYLNDKNKFSYNSFDPPGLINMAFAYCIPDNIQLQLQGSQSSPIQKWFTISVAMSCIGNQTCKTQLTKVQSFFKYNQIRFWISVPKVNSYPVTYDFIQKDLYSMSPLLTQYINVTINLMNFIDDTSNIYPWEQKKYLFQGYSYAYDTQNIFNMVPFSLTNVYYKNLTFNPSYYQTIYKNNVIHLYQIFGMVGGITAFVIFSLGLFAHSFNKFKMLYSISKRLYYIKQIDNTKDFDIDANDLVLFWYMICYYSFIGRRFYRFAPKFQKIIKMIRLTKEQLNLVNYFKLLKLCQNAFGRLLIGSEKQLLKIHLKKIVEEENREEVDKNIDISEISKMEIKKLIQKHELSPFQSRILYKMIEKKRMIGTILRNQQQRLEKIYKIEKQIQKIRIRENILNGQQINPVTQNNQIQQYKINQDSQIGDSVIFNQYYYKNSQPILNQNKFTKTNNQNQDISINHRVQEKLSFQMINEQSFIPINSSEVLNQL